MRELKVLFIEDSEADIGLMAHELKSAYELRWVQVFTLEALSTALNDEWDVVLLDYFVPGIKGFEPIGLVRQGAPHLPVIVVSGLKGEEFAIQAMKAGATDYVLKGNLQRLVPAVERALRESGLRAENRRAEERIEVLNRTVKTISRINQMMVREKDRERLVAETCRILVDDGGFAFAWIGFAESKTGTVAPAAWAGRDEGYLDELEIRCDETPYGMGPTAMAIKSGRPAVCRKPEFEANSLPSIVAAKRSGYTSKAAFPIFHNEAAVGAISVYSSSAEGFTGEVMTLLEELAANISFALKSIVEAGERKMAIAALRDSEERLRTIFESSMDGMFVVDRKDGRFLDVNFAGCHIFGYTREELLSLDPPALLFEDERSAAGGYWQREAFVPEQRMQRKNGEEIWVDLAVTHFSVGTMELALCVKRDVSDRKRAEEALLESEERFHQIFEQSDDAQIIFAHYGCGIMDVNPAAVALYGWRKKELVEKGPGLFMGESLQRFEKAMASVGRGFRLNRLEHLRRDGSAVTVSVKARVVMLERSAVVYCTFKDLTDRMRMEEEAREIQAKLVHANKMTSIGTLASGVAHEINNPNNFILFNSSLLQEAWGEALGILDRYYRDNGDFSLGGLPFSEMRDVIPELITGITDGSRRIKSIVDNLRDFSRVDKSGLAESVDLNSIVMGAISILGNQIGRYTSNFRVALAEDLPRVKGNAQKLEQVVINLVINSLHALHGKNALVEVSTSRGGSGEAVITVKDEGAGMTREVLEHITEPFFTTKSDTGGTGLGLSISYSIIKEHKGVLEFESEPGKGTVAKVIIPAY